MWSASGRDLSGTAALTDIHQVCGTSVPVACKFVAVTAAYGGQPASRQALSLKESYMLLITCLHPLNLQGRWARYEEQLERAHATQQAFSMDQGRASKRQIFSK